MKTQILKYGFHTSLLILVIYSSILAQSNSVKKNVNAECKKQTLGMFRQVTGSSWEATEESIGLRFINDEKAKKENRVPLFEIDEVDPAYKFDVLYKNPESIKCGETVEIVGRLFSPMGKIFDFKQATYDTFFRKLKFTTVERDNITYEVEVQFYAESVFIKGGFHQGTVKLKATGKILGTVLMEFPITSYGFS